MKVKRWLAIFRKFKTALQSRELAKVERAV